jgi:hypothetical protein
MHDVPTPHSADIAAAIDRESRDRAGMSDTKPEPVDAQCSAQTGSAAAHRPASKPEYTMPLEVFANHFIQPRLDRMTTQLREDQTRFASEVLARVITVLREHQATITGLLAPPPETKKRKKRKSK